jgi:hypothetical protein
MHQLPRNPVLSEFLHIMFRMTRIRCRRACEQASNSGTITIQTLFEETRCLMTRWLVNTLADHRKKPSYKNVSNQKWNCSRRDRDRDRDVKRFHDMRCMRSTRGEFHTIFHNQGPSLKVHRSQCRTRHIPFSYLWLTIVLNCKCAHKHTSLLLQYTPQVPSGTLDFALISTFLYSKRAAMAR